MRVPLCVSLAPTAGVHGSSRRRELPLHWLTMSSEDKKQRRVRIVALITIIALTLSVTGGIVLTTIFG